MGADELPVRSPDSDIELSSLTAQGKEAGEKTSQHPYGSHAACRQGMHVCGIWQRGWTGDVAFGILHSCLRLGQVFVRRKQCLPRPPAVWARSETDSGTWVPQAEHLPPCAHSVLSHDIWGCTSSTPLLQSGLLHEERAGSGRCLEVLNLEQTQALVACSSAGGKRYRVTFPDYGDEHGIKGLLKDPLIGDTKEWIANRRRK